MIYPALVQSNYSGTRFIDWKCQYDKDVSFPQANLKNQYDFIKILMSAFIELGK